MSFNKRILSAGAATIVPSEHFGVVLYEGDATTSHKINGGKFGPGANTSNDGVVTLPDNIIDVPEHSVSVWFYMDETSGTQHLMEFDETNRIIIRCASGDSNWAYVGNSGYFNHGMSFSVDTWYHIVVTFKEGSPFKIYQNGSLEYTHGSNVDRYANSSNNDVGAGSSTGGSNVEGKIDQLRIFHKELSASEVTTLYQESATTVTSLTPLGNETEDTLDVFGDSSCLALYKFENDETDASGNYNGTGTSIEYAVGRFGQCASFNGTSSKITTSGKPFNNDTSISISFWAKNINYGDYVSILGEGGDSSTAGYRLLWKNSNDGNIALARSNGDGSYIIPDSYFYDFGVDGSSWVHCAFTVSSSEIKYYKNGANVLTQSVSNSSSTASEGNFGIGADPNYPARLWSGQIDQVRLFNKTLSASEVTSLYKENSLVASYRFEGNAEDDRRTYNGTATNLSYDYALGFTPDLVWCKRRNEGSDHNITDSTRGVQKGLNINTNAVEGAQAPYGVKSFDSGGFTVSDNAGGGASVNGEDDDYVAWCWRANGGTTSSNTDGSGTSTVQVNTDAGFSIAKMTFAGAGSIGHGLGVAPDLVILKGLTAAEDWQIYHSDIGTGKYLSMSRNSGTDATTTRADSFSAVSSTIVTNNWTGSSVAWIMYSFVSIDGFSKFGSYTGNGSANGPIVETGFEPAFIMFKRTDGTSGWNIQDNRRNTINPRTGVMQAHNGDQEYTSSSYAIDFLSNGFKIQTSDNGWNTSSGTYIYMAFATDPDEEAPTLAKSFDIKTWAGGQGDNATINGLGFKPGMVWYKTRNETNDHNLSDSIRGATYQVRPNRDISQVNGTDLIKSFDTDGFTLGTGGDANASGDTYVAWSWKANDNEPTILPNSEESSLISKYKFNNDANDTHGTNHATASNVSYTLGKFGTTADFNGSSSKILYPTASPFNDSNTILAVSAWVKLGSAGDEFVVLGASSTSDSADYMMLVVGGNQAGRIFMTDAPSNANEYQANFGSSNDTNWNHYVWQLSASGGIQLWMNGTSQTRSETVQNGSLDETKWFGDLTYATDVQYATGINRVVTTGYSDGTISNLRLFNAELSSSSITSLYNEASEAVVSANANAGFSIVKYDGTYPTHQKIPHGLSAAPNMILIKNLADSADWEVYHSATGNTGNLVLNDTAAFASNSGFMANTSPTATVFTVGNDGYVNGAGDGHIAYCFHDVTGYSKFGSYEGNQTLNTDNVVNFGFAPDFVMIKNADEGGSQWIVIDSVRTNGYAFYANTSATESNYSTDILISSQGLRFVSNNINVNKASRTYIYAAFKIN